MGEEPHGEDFLTVVVDCSDKTEIACDIENSDCALDDHLICMSESLSGLG
jgi:hypothetical protein